MRMLDAEGWFKPVQVRKFGWLRRWWLLRFGEVGDYSDGECRVRIVRYRGIYYLMDIEENISNG